MSLGLVGLALASSGCRKSTVEEAPGRRPPAETLALAVRGCDAHFTDGACLRDPKLEPREIVVWLGSELEPAQLRVELDGRALDRGAGGFVAREGELGRVAVFDPKLEGTLTIEHAGGRFTLELGWISEEVVKLRPRVEALADEEGVAAARAELAEHRELSSRERYLLECALARFDREGARVELRERARAEGELACVSFHDGALAFEDMIAHDHAAARRDIELLEARGASNLDARLQAAYYRGILAESRGLLDEALAAHERTAAVAALVGDVPIESSAFGGQATALLRLGRLDEAAARAREAEALASGALQLGARHNRLWIDIVRRSEGARVPDPSTQLRELVEDFEDRGDAVKAASARLNLAVALEQRGALDEAETTLASIARDKLSDPRDQLYLELTRSRLARARGHFDEADLLLERAELLAQSLGGGEFELELLDARAKLELDRGRVGAARRAFATAERRADALARGIAPDRGRSSFLNTTTRSRARYVELLFELDEPEVALCTILGAKARHARALGGRRLARDPAQRAKYDALIARYHERRADLEGRLAKAWSLSKQDLAALRDDEDRAREEIDGLLERALALLERAPPTWSCAAVRPREPGAALLTLYPRAAAEGGWWFVLDRGGDVHVHVHAEAEGGEAVVARAVDHFATQGLLVAVEELSFVPLTELGLVDLHRLGPFAAEGGPRVRYELALGIEGEGAAREFDAKQAAVVVSDADLLAAGAEGERVRAELRERGWTVDEDWSVEAERQPSLLHFAGHADHAGLAGWSSYLRLPDGRELDVRSLLVEQRAPRFVILGACDAGTSSGATVDGGMNMALAFLLAGAELVVAPNQRVDDEVAAAFAEALHTRLPARTELEAAGLVTAVTELGRADPRFAAWRSWGR